MPWRTITDSRAAQTQGIAEELDAAAIDLRGPAQQAVRREYLNIGGEDVLDQTPARCSRRGRRSTGC